MRGRECEQYQVDNNPQLKLNIQLMKHLRGIFPGVAFHWVVWNMVTNRVYGALYQDKITAITKKEELCRKQASEEAEKDWNLNTKVNYLDIAEGYRPDWLRGIRKIHGIDDGTHGSEDKG